jgi:hypothetical protein
MQKGNRAMDENPHNEEPFESEELPPLGPGQLRITKEIAGKRERSLYISYTDSYNVVEVDFVDGTSLSVELFPMVELKAELNNWKVENGEVLKRWPRMFAR